MEEVYSTPQVAKMLGTSPQEVRYLIKTGKFGKNEVFRVGVKGMYRITQKGVEGIKRYV